MSAIVGDMGIASGVTLLPTHLVGDGCSITMPWPQVMFVCRGDKDDMTDGLLPRLDSKGRMSLSAGKKLMSVRACSAYEFVRDMVGEVGGVLKISKSSSSVDISQVAYPIGWWERRGGFGATRGGLYWAGSLFKLFLRWDNFILHSPIKFYLKTVTQATRDVGFESKPVRVLYYLVGDA